MRPSLLSISGSFATGPSLLRPGRRVPFRHRPILRIRGLRLSFLPLVTRIYHYNFTRHSNAIVLLDQSWSCEHDAKALLLDDDTVRDWHRAYEQGGVEGLKSFGHEGGSSHLTDEQAIALRD